MKGNHYGYSSKQAAGITDRNAARDADRNRAGKTR